MNDFGGMCIILGEVWFAYRYDEAFTKFVNQHAAAFALAYSVSAELATATSGGRKLVTDLWDLFLDQMSADKNTVYVSLNHVLESIGSAEER